MQIILATFSDWLIKSFAKNVCEKWTLNLFIPTVVYVYCRVAQMHPNYFLLPIISICAAGSVSLSIFYVSFFAQLPRDWHVTPIYLLYEGQGRYIHYTYIYLSAPEVIPFALSFSRHHSATHTPPSSLSPFFRHSRAESRAMPGRLRFATVFLFWGVAVQ